MPALAPSPVLYIDSLDRAAALLKPLRTELLRRMAEPTTCGELAEAVGETPQKVHYHVKVLEKAGLVERTGERQARGFVEAIYRAAARSYWLAPNLVRRMGGRAAARDQASLAALCGHAEEMLEDVGRLAHRATEGERVPSLSLSAQVELGDPERRAAFLAEVTEAFRGIAERYGASSGDGTLGGGTFKMTLGCYPVAVESRESRAPARKDTTCDSGMGWYSLDSRLSTLDSRLIKEPEACPPPPTITN